MIPRTDSIFAPSAAKAHYEKRLFALNMLFFGFVFFVFSNFAPIRFETNDDVVMLLIASGAYTGTPDPHLVFINILIGYFLNFLYNNIQGIEFYTCFLIAVHIYSSAAIATFIQRLNLPKILAFTLFVLLLAFELFTLSNLQFTTTSGILALAGVVRQIHGLPKIHWEAVCAFSLASCIRFEAAILVLSLSWPLMIQKDILINSLKPIGIFLLAAGLLKVTDNLSYRNNPDWQNYKLYLDIRLKINDNPNDHQFKPNSAAEGNDYLLNLAFLPNPAAISIDRLKEISKELQETPFQQKISNIAPALLVYKTPLLILFGALFILLAKTLGHTRKKIILATIIYTIFLLYIPLNNIFKPRVFIISIAPILFIIIPLAAKKIQSKISLLSLSAIISLFILGTVFTSIHRLRSNIDRKSIITEQLVLIEDYFSKNNKPIYGIRLYGEYLNPFTLSSKLSDKNFTFGGWLTKIPFPQHLNSYEDLLNKSMLMGKEEVSTTVPMMIRSFKDNHNKNVTHSIVLESERYAILEFVER